MAEHSQGPFETDRKGIIDANGDPLFLTGADGTVWWKNDFDAHLLAAAHDLIEALKAAALSAGFQYMLVETRDKIEAAIAKAEGRSHG
jgi:hypothetical protein